MIQPISNNEHVNIRIANFTKMELSWKNAVNFDLANIPQVAAEIRRYADLPYIYLISKDQVETIAELLIKLKSIRSTCYPYAIIVIEDSDRRSSTELFADDFDLDIISINRFDTETIDRKVSEYAASKLAFDRSKLIVENTRSIPNYVDVIVIGIIGYRTGITQLCRCHRHRRRCNRFICSQ